MMPASVGRNIDEVRAAAIDLGFRRDENRAEAERIADQIRDRAQEAREAGMSMAEFARLIGIDRTNLYRVYLERDERE